MKIAGLISTKDEVKEVTFIAKMFVVSNRARLLAQQSKN